MMEDPNNNLSNYRRHATRARASKAAMRGSNEFRNSFRSEVSACSSTHATNCVAPFERSEISLGIKLGSGSFSDVYEITSFHLAAGSGCHLPDDEKNKREEMAREMSDPNGARYVLKQLKPSMEGSQHFAAAAYDISHEAEMLSALDHENIVKIHGRCARGHDAFLNGCTEYFIILERLDTMLDEKIKTWTSKKMPLKLGKILTRRANLLGGRKISKKYQVPPIKERLEIAASLASAIEYLHKSGIIFRDLKPNNVGFDSHGSLKLLDFGLARVLPSAAALDDVFKMSMAGSPRYSSPEVLCDQPYGAGHDVWSFCLILSEILSLRCPFEGCKDFDALVDAIVVDGKRPRLDSKWPKAVNVILQRGFSMAHFERPSMTAIHSILYTTLSE